jgi:MFS family permease
MEATITSTAMPKIVGSLHGLEHYAWVASIYLLASTITMPLYGRLSDLLGRKRVLMFSITLFAVGSVLSSTSLSMGQLIVCRGLQGLGAGGIMPVVLTVLGDIFTLKERAAMQAVFSAVWGTAALAGPALGAFLVGTERFAGSVPAWVRPWLGWPSIFWVNLPTGAVAMLVLAMKYHEHKSQAPGGKTGLQERLDLRGMIWLSVGSTALLAGVSLAAGVTVPWWVPAGAVAAGAGAFWGFIRHERVAMNPIMPASLMMHRSIGPAMVVSGLLGVGVFAVDTYVPLYVQGGRGWTVSAAAAAVTPVLFAWALSGLMVMPLMIRWGFRRLVTAGSILVTAGFVGLFLSAVFQWPLWILTSLLFMTGIGFSPCSMGTLLSAQDAVEYEQRGIVTSGVTFFRNFGGALGVGLFGALFNLLTANTLKGIIGNEFSTGDLLDSEKLKHIHEEHPQLLLRAQSAISHGLLWVFGAMLAGAVAMILMSRLISPHKHHGKVHAAEMMEGLG